MSTRICYLNVYETGRSYGGPEEGGWWYNTGEPRASVPFELALTYASSEECRCVHDECGCSLEKSTCHGEVTRATIEAHEPLVAERKRLEAVFDYLGGTRRIVVEEHFAEYYPQVTPHYE